MIPHLTAEPTKEEITDRYIQLKWCINFLISLWYKISAFSEHPPTDVARDEELFDMETALLLLESKDILHLGGGSLVLFYRQVLDEIDDYSELDFDEMVSFRPILKTDLFDLCDKLIAATIREKMFFAWKHDLSQ